MNTLKLQNAEVSNVGVMDGFQGSRPISPVCLLLCLCNLREKTVTTFHCECTVCGWL